MDKKQIATDALLQQRFLPLYYHNDLDVSLQLLRTLYREGIHIVEYTNRGDNALSNFSEIKKTAYHEMPDLLVGIGTIKSPADADLFIKAGADFIVCPTVDRDVAAVVHSVGLLWIPGCMTPTEISIAENAGATLIKIFPGSLLGPMYISSIKELFPHLLFMPTGGVEINQDNLEAWFHSGVCAVGMGSKLIPHNLVESRNFEAIGALVQNAKTIIQSIKQ